jgi:hypothetical protein
MHFTDFVLATSVKQHTFRRGGLTGIDVCDDPEITGIFEGIFTRHIDGIKRYVLERVNEVRTS